MAAFDKDDLDPTIDVRKTIGLGRSRWIADGRVEFRAPLSEVPDTGMLLWRAFDKEHNTRMDARYPLVELDESERDREAIVIWPDHFVPFPPFKLAAQYSIILAHLIRPDNDAGYREIGAYALSINYPLMPEEQ